MRNVRKENTQRLSMISPDKKATSSIFAQENPINFASVIAAKIIISRLFKRIVNTTFSRAVDTMLSDYIVSNIEENIKDLVEYECISHDIGELTEKSWIISEEPVIS